MDGQTMKRKDENDDEYKQTLCKPRYDFIMQTQHDNRISPQIL